MAKQLSDLDFTPLDEARPLGEFRPLIGDERALIRMALILGGVLMVWRLYVACISNVIWEESHFVVSGQHLGLAYPDIPGGFAWLARLITTIFGWHVLPLRIVSLLIATAIPWSVYFMATPVVSRRNAIWAAIIAMLLPTATMNGTVYYPEGALQLLLALMLGCLLRAIQSPAGYKWWLWSGVVAMAGLLIHYRFLVPGIAAVVYLLATPEGRAQWRKPGIYIVGVMGMIGMLPAILYNASHDWPAI
ncbi:MAG: glycosyltransferase family 39 protein, partial [Asticcacaulis sp.]